jgi:cyclopropane-fatty-acyl-phospholipid synthase
MFLLKKLLTKVVRTGQLIVIGPDGASHVFGDTTSPPLTIRLKDNRTARAIVSSPELGAGEAYMDGRLVLENGADIHQLMDLFTANLRWSADNPMRKVLDQKNKWTRWILEFNAARASKKNVAHHYDLSDRLYDLFLDVDRQYSCAYFKADDVPLAQAQIDKKAHIGRKLLLQPGMRVLDIGCGWGGMALFLNREYGAEVLGVTLSEEQLTVARRRAAEAGVADKVKFELIDYRSVHGSFDRIVSVGMFEHVGRPNFRTFFDTVCRLLKSDGVALIHTIGRADGPGSTDPWTAKYIFPGGYAPALSEIMPHVEKSYLYTTDIEVWRLHYAKTLWAWYEKTRDHKADIVALYDERFWRMWMFYLAAARAAFNNLGHVVFQLQLTKQIDAVPLTRDYLYKA